MSNVEIYDGTMDLKQHLNAAIALFNKIMAVPLPPVFVMSNIQIYDGTMDPEQHLNAATALSNKIMVVPLPPGFVISNVEFYVGTKDLEQHPDNFATNVLLHGYEDAILYQTFPTTLKGAGRSWFHNQPLYFSNFTDHSNNFYTHFQENEIVAAERNDAGSSTTGFE
ncbi:hypothetical protein NE237_015020 [Protea cynaroides]|uniref:Uncharacterized protein n=1 Tax=Protea cynaroides TaxID=273540 RepID=A0A9Q0KDD1_9MAGN|nr:hypothetical protein NE237_015020 [Protea cynaroides]